MHKLSSIPGAKLHCKVAKIYSIHSVQVIVVVATGPFKDSRHFM